MSLTVEQLCLKLKKCVGEFKKVALTIKIATGIKNFLQGRSYGAWFNKRFAIDYFTVVCLVAWPLNESEAGVDLVLIETSLLLLCNFLII